ncbi:ABC transporter ATP-binding protein [Mycoplasma tauri]|uniref:ABC transporter ATP-binding protein n=1 Tax=Mycoplasma tauri TaxID=547987 RepID=A0A953T6N9_9MOLU|nr:ABC transporter ATP-binding protein [Mycoplasma tauri]MBZ4195376.1 ABC transporter ATP-binding protein [Mycoplasma tauri]MBZ4203975.1 ABC transporter ATP-binding protein [Mycoplasma tauri]
MTETIELKKNPGYSKKFAKPIMLKNLPEPLDLMEIKNEKGKGFWRNFKDYWVEFGRKIKRCFYWKKQNIDIFTGTKKEYVCGEELNVAAEIENIYLTFKNPANPKEKNLVLRGPSLKIYEGKVHALIGESGSGKSVITSLLYGLTGTNAIIEGGKIKLYGLEVQNFTLYNWEKSKLRGRIVSAVFQNPMSILDPTMKVGKQIMEGMLINKLVKNRKEAYVEAIKYLKLTKINNPEAVMKTYPHELSGGMIQRVAIASIVSLKPKILVMDEPTTALDPTVQALVLDIIRELQEKFSIAIAFITHDLGVVASIADFINIMYAGQIVESGTTKEILTNPQHPYTWGLITSMPDFNKGEKLQVIRGAVPSNLNNIVGDAFAVRNDYALNIDFEQEPPFFQISPTHFVKSNLLDSRAPKYEPPKIISKLWSKYNNRLEKIYGADDMYVSDVEFNKYLNFANVHNDKADNLWEERNQILSERNKNIKDKSVNFERKNQFFNKYYGYNHEYNEDR